MNASRRTGLACVWVSGVSWRRGLRSDLEEERGTVALTEMTPAVVSHRGGVENQRLQRQMGCMAGLLHLFDRGFIGRRRSFSVRSLPVASTAGSASPSAKSEASSALSVFKESHLPPPSPSIARPSSEMGGVSGETPARRSLPLPLQAFESADEGKTSWRTIRDSPRLSLDSRAVVDSKGKIRPREIRTAVSVSTGSPTDASEAGEEQRRSPSVVARLMGLDGLSSDDREGGSAPDRVELRRSASEARARKDPSCHGVDSGSPATAESEPISAEEFFKSISVSKFKLTNLTMAKPQLQRKIFDVQDFFPEPKQSWALHGEIEKWLRMRGFNDSTKGTETVKQILEALQLKGLLHRNPSHLVNDRRNPFAYQRSSDVVQTPIVIMNPATKPPRLPPRSGASRQSPPPIRRQPTPVDRPTSGRNEQRNRGLRSPESLSSPVKRLPDNAAVQKSSLRPQTISPVSSPKRSPKRSGSDPLRSPGTQRPTADPSPVGKNYSPAEDDTFATFSESSGSASSQLDFERSLAEEYRSGRTVLQRCNKLVDSIAEFTGVEKVSVVDRQPSPVSVLDSLSFLGSPSPSPLSKRCIDFKDRQTDEWEESQWSSTESTNDGDVDIWPEDVDHDYAYVCEVVRACHRYKESCGAVYAMLEKRHAGNSCKADRLHRRLVFDTVAEILDRKRRVSSREAFSRTAPSSPACLAGGDELLLRQVWTELQRIREQLAAEEEESNVEDTAVVSAVRKDINAGLTDGWTRPGAEMSDAILHIERLIFKELVSETIHDLAAATSRRRRLPRRKLDL
ncbi:protein LONGIFOLIA 2-like [Zingiber officinale]|uniref:DUF4378 domain-containing protein n=1 Tax=Zingiber officinale TaxID=94328 RepID=A0A8J5HDA4_ZINOF|nr:protein LONGIFOLIA 2-like [Zingiber officinale]KAG6524723.1 hypothetical protein ZIOFF_014661 [Zingiber officinale]